MISRKVIVFLTLALLAIALALPASAAQRQCVILEGFTQWNCGPCADWNPHESNVLNQMTRDSVISVKYHVTWPSPDNDIMNHWNPSENGARRTMYGVNAVPATFIDGTELTSQSEANVRNRVRAQLGESSPCTIELIALTQTSTTVFVTGSVDAEEDLTGLRLFVALITNNEYAPPQGSNGESSWYDVFRDMAPNATGGYILTANAGGSQSFEFTLNCDAEWDPDNMHVVAWVQNTNSREIVQGTHTEVLQDYAFVTYCSEVGQRWIQPADEEYTYTINLSNIGNLSDNYSVNILGSIPANWTRSIEADGVTQHESTISVPLESHETSDLVVRLNPNGNPGFADFQVSVTSSNTVIESLRGFRIMGGLDVLIMDDDLGYNYETYYLDALQPYAEANDLAVGAWDPTADYLDANDWYTADVIVWACTVTDLERGNTLTPLDQLFLGDYLLDGGTLLLSGQGIGYDIRTDQFMSDYLHCGYVQNYPQGLAVTAVEGDPITDGLDTPITGGTGADNQRHQSALSPLDDSATPIYTYTDSELSAAMRIHNPAWPDGYYRVVYLGFGFESIADQDTREELMANSIDWLYGAILSTPEEEAGAAVPHTFALGQNFPNPFNPETTIPFSLAARSEVTLNIYDILGRQVAELAAGAFEAGAHSVNWNPTGLSSGIYFYKLEAVAGDNTFRDTRKLVLMK